MIEIISVREHLANSDHNRIFFDAILYTIDRPGNIKKLNFKKGKYDEMRSWLSQVNWEKELDFESNDANASWNNFRNILISAMTEFIPPVGGSKHKYPPMDV